MNNNPLVLQNEEYLLPASYTIVESVPSAQITFSRSGGASYFDSTGKLVRSAGNVARANAYLQDGSGDFGLFIEGGSTNVCLQSEDLSTTWTTNNSTVVDDSETAPDEIGTADLIFADTATDVHNIEQTFTGSTSNNFTASVFAKQGSSTDLHLRVSDTTDSHYIDMIVDLSDGSVSQAAAATGANATLNDSGVESYNDGWYRVWISGIADSTTTSQKLVVGIADGTTLSFTGVGDESISVWGCQLEESDIPATYINTFGTSSTRGADEFLLDLSSYSWFNNTEGTIVVDFKRYAEVDNTKTMVIQLDDGDVDNSINIFQSATSKQIVCEVTDTASSQVSITTSTGDSNIRAKVAFAYKANDFAVSVNGAAVSTDTSGTVPTGIVNMRIGYDETGSQLNGIIRTLTYYDTRLDDADLVALST